MSSGGFSEYDDGGEFGAPGVKINEWQAAWNITNAIQVRKKLVNGKMKTLMIEKFVP